MATSFFEHQDAARRNTSRLVFLFVLAVLAMLGMLYALAVGLLHQLGSRPDQAPPPLELWQPELLANVAALTILIVAVGSLYKILQLRGGGSVVAEALGGTLVPPNTRDPAHRKLLNVVEEMAIASGSATPPVYVMEHEAGINAFAAGFTPGDAVIGVTRGCIEQLDRDELQGVIAHEFSHIFNGDMRLNIRLMGVLHGILLIGMIGYFLLRSSMWSGAAGRRSSRDNNVAFMLALGLGLSVIGFLGTFFGNMIKASVSRQREFLADASAVQFTRNPMGLAGALKTIAGYSEGSILANPHAPESSHLFFSQGLRGGFQLLFATHPPLDERIRRLEPSWQSEATMPAPRAARPAAAGAAGLVGAEASGAPASAIDSIGEPTPAHVAYASALIRGLPDALLDAARDTHGARAVIYALLLDPELESRARQRERLREAGDSGIEDETTRIHALVEQIRDEARLPLVDLALPALRQLSPDQYRRFRDNVRALVDADRRIDLFEWTLQRILLTHLRPHFERVRPHRVRHSSHRAIAGPTAVTLSILAYAGARDAAAAGRAFAQGKAEIPGSDIALLPIERCGLADLDPALLELAESRPALKRDVLRACATTIAADHSVSVREGELLRAIADAMDCPVPPLLPGQPLY